MNSAILTILMLVVSNVFTVVATFVFQGQSIRWNHIVAFLLLVGAVYFSFLDTSK